MWNKLWNRISKSFLFAPTKNYKSGIGVLEIKILALTLFFLSIPFPQFIHAYYYIVAFTMTVISKNPIKKTAFFVLPSIILMQCMYCLFCPNREMTSDLGVSLFVCFLYVYGMKQIKKMKRGKFISIYFITGVAALLLVKGVNTPMLLYAIIIMLCMNRIQAELLSILFSGNQWAFVILGAIISHFYNDTKQRNILCKEK